MNHSSDYVCETNLWGRPPVHPLWSNCS